MQCDLLRFAVVRLVYARKKKKLNLCIVSR